jgi:phenylacetate-CoA ligase
MAIEELFDKYESMSAIKREEHLTRLLRKAIENAYKRAPAVKDLFDKAGIIPDSIEKIEDLQKIPITRKNDLIDRQKTYPPYGGYLTIPIEDIERVFLSPGPVYEPLHFSNINWFARSFWAAGFRKGDVVVNTFTYHMSPAGMLFHEAIRDCGATAIAMGTGHTEILLKTIVELKVTGYVGTPSFLKTVIDKSSELGYRWSDIKLARAWFTGEPLSSSLRSLFESKYGIDTYQTYAVTEPGGALAYECSQKSGMHLMDDYILEIVDPDTGTALDIGKTGEIIVTPLHNPAWGLVRFGTGDLSRLSITKCRCGRTAPQLSGILGRIGESIKVRGMFVVPKQVEEVFTTYPQVNRFKVIVRRKEERDELTILLEILDSAISDEELKLGIASKFQSICLIRPDIIDFVPEGTIHPEAKKLEDLRSWE